MAVPAALGKGGRKGRKRSLAYSAPVNYFNLASNFLHHDLIKKTEREREGKEEAAFLGEMEGGGGGGVLWCPLLKDCFFLQKMRFTPRPH